MTLDRTVDETTNDSGVWLARGLDALLAPVPYGLPIESGPQPATPAPWFQPLPVRPREAVRGELVLYTAGHQVFRPDSADLLIEDLLLPGGHPGEDRRRLYVYRAGTGQQDGYVVLPASHWQQVVSAIVRRCPTREAVIQARQWALTGRIVAEHP